MKNCFSVPGRLLAAAAIALGAGRAGAFTYTDQDVLLVLRKPGNNDLIYNLGQVSALTSLADGTKLTITSWDSALAQATYGNLADGVKFAVMATTSREDANRRAWLTIAEDDTTPLDRTATQLQNIFAKVDSVGTKARVATETNSVQVFNVSNTANNSYTYVASNAGSAPALIPKLGGTSTFTIEGDVPRVLRFVELHASTVIPKPEATILGRFELGTDGTLTYTAGNGTVLPPLVSPEGVRVVAADGQVEIHFTGVVGSKYRLRYTDSAGLATPVAGWTAGDATVDGAAGDLVLKDATSAPGRFYVVEAFR